MQEQNTPPQPNPSPQSAGDIGHPSKDDMNMAMLCHLLGIFTGFLGPLIIWLVKKDESTFVDEAGKESVNFQITLIIVYLVLSVFTCVTLGLGALLMFPVIVVSLVFMILATVASTKGEMYRYPMCIRLIK